MRTVHQRRHLSIRREGEGKKIESIKTIGGGEDDGEGERRNTHLME